jgi:hypothetical protein
MNEASLQNLLAQLHLGAVFATLPDLVRLDPASAAFVKDWNMSLRMGSSEGPQQTIHFENGRPAAAPGALPRLTLHYLSNRQLNAAFLRKGFSLPLPLSGWLQLPKITGFLKLTDRFESLMRHPGNRIPSDPLLVRLSLLVALRGLTVLAQHEDESRSLVKKLPAGLACFELPDGNPCWVALRNGTITMGTGAPATTPDARIRFMDWETAADALSPGFDNLAAVGRGRIRIEGLLPLTDGLSLVMERLPLYLQP